MNWRELFQICVRRIAQKVSISKLLRCLNGIFKLQIINYLQQSCTIHSNSYGKGWFDIGPITRFLFGGVWRILIYLRLSFPGIVGFGSLIESNNSAAPRGIDRGASPCSCNRDTCTCFPVSDSKKPLFKFSNTSQTPERTPADEAGNLNVKSGTEKFIKSNSHTAGS